VGSIIALCNVVGSYVLVGSPVQLPRQCLCTAAGHRLRSRQCGLRCSRKGRAIVATLATGATFSGFALLLRPSPGGSVDESLSNLLTFETFGAIPTSLLLLVLVVMVTLGPLSRTLMGRSIRAIGSNASGAYMSGLKSGTATFTAYGLSASSLLALDCFSLPRRCQEMPALVPATRLTRSRPSSWAVYRWPGGEAQ